MSEQKHIIEVSPPKSLDSNQKGEVIIIEGCDCPKCNGKGGFDQSGWMAKFKKELTEPDWLECTVCKGYGKLDAQIVIGWRPSLKKEK